MNDVNESALKETLQKDAKGLVEFLFCQIRCLC